MAPNSLSFILEELGDIEFAKSSYRTAHTFYERALTDATSSPGSPTALASDCARFHRKLATIAKKQGDQSAITSHCEQALIYLQQYPANAEEVRIQLLLAYVKCHEGHFMSGFQKYRGLLGIARRLGDDQLRAEILDAVGAAYLYKGDSRKAAEYLRQSLPIHQRLGDLQRVADLVNNLGIIYAQTYAYTQAKDYFTEALKLYQSLDFFNGIANCNNNLGILCYNRGSYEEAKQHYLTAFTTHKEVGNLRGVVQCRVNLAETHIAQQTVPSALFCLKEATMGIRSAGCDLYLPHVHRLFGEAHLLQNNYKMSLEEVKTASKLAEKMHDQFEQAGSACLFGDIATAMGQYEQAAQYYRASLASFRAMDERLPLAKTMLHYGRLLLQERFDMARGAHFLQEAATIYSGLDNHTEYLKVILAIRRFGVGRNNLDTAQAHSKSSLS